MAAGAWSFAGSHVAGYLALVAPVGLVVREGAMVSLLSLPAAIPAGPAATLALAARLWTTAVEPPSFGLICLPRSVWPAPDQDR